MVTDMVLIDKGAVTMALNALRRDAAAGKEVRGEMADEIEKACVDIEPDLMPLILALSHLKSRPWKETMAERLNEITQLIDAQMNAFPPTEKETCYDDYNDEGKNS